MRSRRRAPINVYDVRLHEAEVGELAERHIDQLAHLWVTTTSGLTGYDAAYLWLSRHNGAELATFDRKLKAASMS